MTPDEIASSVYSKNTKILFKSFLILIEDLHKDHEINFKKLKKALPQEFESIIDQADYFDHKKLQYLRKKILDMGNETIRETESNFENFTISFKF
jgi:hypothetical protein